MDYSKTTRVLVVLAGTGKTSQIPLIKNGELPNTFLLALGERNFDRLQVTYIDAVPAWLPVVIKGRWRRLLGSLSLLVKYFSNDVVITTDVGLSEFVVGLTKKVTRGMIGPFWIFISINTSSLIHSKESLSSLRIKKSVWSLASKIVCLANFQKDDLVNLGLSEELITVIPLGVDARFFKRGDERIKLGKYIFSVGVDKGRDFDFLLGVAREIPYPVIIATSERNIPKDTPVSNNVTVLYNIPVKEIRRRYTEARMAVVPLKNTLIEGGSDCSGQTVTLEGLAAGVPTLVTPTPWVKEYLSEEREYVPLAGTRSEASNQILRLWNNEPVLKSMSDSGEKTIKEKYTEEILADKLAEITLLLTQNNSRNSDRG